MSPATDRQSPDSAASPEPGAAPTHRGPSERLSAKAYRAAERVPLGLGKAVFSRVVRIAAPYFVSIPVSVDSAEPGRAVAKMRHYPWVRNHLGTVHAIALCNLAEYVMGVAAENTVPADWRWIPKGMTVEYLKKAQGTMTATATMSLPEEVVGGAEVPVGIAVCNDDDEVVFTAEIRLWVTESA